MPTNASTVSLSSLTTLTDDAPPPEYSFEARPPSPAPSDTSTINVNVPPSTGTGNTKVLDTLPRNAYISRITTETIPGAATTRRIYHVDPRTFHPVPLHSHKHRLSIRNGAGADADGDVTTFMQTQLYNPHQDTRTLREITSRDALEYAALGFRIAGKWVLLSTMFEGEVARTTVGWVHSWREEGGVYWRFLTAKDGDVESIVDGRMAGTAGEACRSVSREEREATSHGRSKGQVVVWY
ncbi:hypothetical protein Dda_2605 [Drechslerella dactyloides]|uniref:Uncharacterized protein n=1 Tax=Drechslerella dactyloides TaxID=74499 RepID=A0AAD6NJJ4_DREDA|nr:hypothetical protein Dda_2605 [Drechslerella dactyloides]